MSSLFRRIKRPGRKPADDTLAPSPDPEVQAAAASPSIAAPQSGHPPLLAGEDPADARPTSLRRGRLRKHMRFLDREHDLMLRDLGGLVYEVHRSGEGGNEEHHRQLVTGKLERLSRVDAERQAAASVLSRPDADLVLREPGIGGLCPRCAELFGSDAHFCSACGFPVSERAIASTATTWTQAPGAAHSHSAGEASTPQSDRHPAEPRLEPAPAAVPSADTAEVVADPHPATRRPGGDPGASLDMPTVIRPPSAVDSPDQRQA